MTVTKNHGRGIDSAEVVTVLMIVMMSEHQGPVANIHQGIMIVRTMKKFNQDDKLTEEIDSDHQEIVMMMRRMVATETASVEVVALHPKARRQVMIVIVTQPGFHLLPIPLAGREEVHAHHHQQYRQVCHRLNHAIHSPVTMNWPRCLVGIWRL